MAKLKIITLTVELPPNENPFYTAIDQDGKVLATRDACLSCLGTTYIAAVITKNRDHTYAYSMYSMFTNLRRITTKLVTDERCVPYAIAIVEERKAAFRKWYKENKAKQKPVCR